MTLGKAGVLVKVQDTFNGPAVVAIAPNSDIFIADGHNNTRVDEIFQRRNHHQGLGNERIGSRRIRKWYTAWRSIPRDACSWPIAATRESDFDKGREVSRRVETVRQPQRDLCDKNDVMYVADSDSNTRTIPDGNEVFGLVARKTVQGHGVYSGWPEPNPDSDAADPRSGLKISVTSAAEGVAADSPAIFMARKSDRPCCGNISEPTARISLETSCCFHRTRDFSWGNFPPYAVRRSITCAGIRRRCGQSGTAAE